MKTKQTSLLILLLSVTALVWAKEPPVIGKLGRIVGTALTIEAKRSPPWKGDYLLVTTVDGVELQKPILLAVANLAQPFNISTNTICRFKGHEITYVIQPVVNPKTGEELQQAASGRHFEFKVTEVLTPDEVKVKKEESPNKQMQNIGTNAPNSDL